MQPWVEKAAIRLPPLGRCHIRSFPGTFLGSRAPTERKRSTYDEKHGPALPPHVAVERFFSTDLKPRCRLHESPRAAMASDTDKLTTTVVPLNPRPEVRQALLTVIIFCALIAVWSALRLYARRVRHTPLNVEDTLFYVSVV